MDIQLHQTPDAFGLPEWRRLHEADPNRSIFSTPEWNAAWWEHFGEGKELFVLTFLDPEPVGMAALMLDQTKEGGRVRFVGGDDLTDYLGPLVSGEQFVPAIADSLVQFIREEIGGWGYLEAKALPVPFGFADRLVEAASRHGLEFEIEQDDVSPVLPLPATFDDYLEWLRPKQRHELRRKLRKFDREAPASNFASASEQSLPADVASFIEMHRYSQGVKGEFMNPSRERFFRRIAETFFPLGMAGIEFLEVSGHRVAITFSFRYEKVFYLYNSAFSRDYRELSPGLVLAAKLIEQAINDGFERFDFLRGKERYKFDLGAEPLPLHSVRLTNPRK